MVLDRLVAMDQYFELEEITDSERVRFTTTKLKKTKRQAYGEHMYDRRGSRRTKLKSLRSAFRLPRFAQLRACETPKFKERASLIHPGKNASFGSFI